MTYPKTLLLFVLPAIVVAGTLAWFVARDRFDARFWKALAVLFVVVYAATIPWDNLAVKWGIWFFDWSKTWGVRFAYLPLEEYLFFGLETLLTALVWGILSSRSSARVPARRKGSVGKNGELGNDGQLGARTAADPHDLRIRNGGKRPEGAS